jgi:hypothetical protein
MHAVLIWIARLTGITGLLVMALAAFARLGGGDVRRAVAVTPLQLLLQFALVE